MYQKPIENSPGIDFNTPELKKYRSIRFLKDLMAHWGVAAGGLGVIVAILLIFFYLLYEVAPLFKSTKIHAVSSYSQSEIARPLYLAVEEQAEIAFRAYPDGSLVFSSTTSGEEVLHHSLPVPEGVQITRIEADASGANFFAAGLSNGQIILFEQDYRISWPNNKRVITPVVTYPFGQETLSLFAGEDPVEHLTLSSRDDLLLVAASAGGQMDMAAYWMASHFLTGAVTLEQQELTLPRVDRNIAKIMIDPDQNWLYVATHPDQLTLINISDVQSPFLHSQVDLTEDETEITELEFLLGGISLLAGDAKGGISQWFLVRDGEERTLQKIRSFQLGNQPVVQIIPEQRRKGFLAVDTSGQLGVFHTTAHNTLLKKQLFDASPGLLAIAPRANYLMADSGGESDSAIKFFRVENEHPEISWSALWQKVWYESYDQPEYVWQSSASNTDFEAKLSLTPLSFGTLKAAFYAMLMAAPLAICGAIYTAYFMAPVMRRKVKPLIELMEALPTVILGFLAGLWLAPLVENNLPGIFALLMFVPIGILVFAFIWDNLPDRIRLAIPDGWQAALLIPVILLCGWMAMSLSGEMEQLFFAGDMRTWLTSELGIPYDQRNALVVGLAMGFAVIPTIFSIAEDAIFSVPKHLTYGSLALGATPWQTLTRVVLLTASPGIFSALMIGMGRAVGETMIVLMATGNTPIMDANIFEGMRTLAANIAVEMPESEVGSSHYRILFLSALVLFLFTFVVNTAAELVRHRLRKKYSSL